MPQLPSHFDRATKEFSDIRRQFYMYWEAYEEILEKLDKSIDTTKTYIASVPGTQYEFSLGTIAEYSSLFEDALNRISLEYTAGAPIEELKGLYPAAVDAFEAWCFAFRDWHYHEFPESKAKFEADKAIPIDVELDVSTSYIELLRLLSLGVLFRENAQLLRISKLIKSLRREDIIVEELLLPFVPDGIEME
jgi:hypothetical protein